MSTKTPELRVINTSQYSDDIVNRCVDFALRSVMTIPGNLNRMRSVKVQVTNTSYRMSGRAFCGENRMLIRIGNPELFTAEARRYPTYENDENFPLQQHRDFIEGIVGVSAHEFMHLHDTKIDVSKPKEQEFRAEIAESDALEEFRKQRSEWEARLAADRRRAGEREEAQAAREAELERIRTSPEHLIGRLLDQKKRWEAKKRRAETAIKKLNRRIAARQRVMANVGKN